MRAENAYQRFFQATGLIRTEPDIPEWIAPPGHVHGCSRCARPWDQVELPGLCAAYQYQKGRAIAFEYECATCHTPRIRCETTLGAESYRGPSKDKPAWAKLGMLPGCGAVITPGEEMHLAVLGGWHRKFIGGLYGRAGRLYDERPLAMLLRLLAEKRLGNLADGVVFIREFGRKPDVLMSHLRLTRSLSEVWCCSEIGAECVDLEALIATARWLHGNDLGTQATRPGFWKPIRDAAAGKRDSNALAKWASKVPGPQALLDTLPLDPHARLALPSYMAAIMPHVEGGDL